MRKLLRLEDYLRLGFSFGVDLFEDVAGAGGLAGFSYQQIYGFVPRKYRKSYLYKKVHQLLKTGQIERIIKNGQPFFRLSNSGKKKIVRDFPILSMQRKKWDKKWRLVIFDIPEKKRKARNALREKLIELGFGKWQRSIYISPHDFGQDLRDFLKSWGLADRAFVLEANVFSPSEGRILAEKVWPLTKINGQYQEIINQWEKREGKDKTKLKKKIKNQYLKILIVDPLLPQELLPKEWLGERIRRLVRKF